MDWDLVVKMDKQDKLEEYLEIWATRYNEWKF
jgi:hypothetical protein